MNYALAKHGGSQLDIQLAIMGWLPVFFRFIVKILDCKRHQLAAVIQSSVLECKSRSAQVHVFVCVTVTVTVMVCLF
jgi:hypothetical protein